MSYFNPDLHCHSIYSDGTLAPTELASLAHKNGVDLWALTDHDDISGQKEALEMAIHLGIHYVCGVEISVTYLSQTVHIIGLGIDINDPGLMEGLQATREGRNERAKEMGRQLEQVGIPNAYEGALKYVANKNLISRTHFSRYIVELGRCKDNHEVFKHYLIPGKPGFIEHQWATLANAVTWIRNAGGVAIIAHPGRYPLSAKNEITFIEQFKALGGMGIEVATSNHNQEQFEKYLRLSNHHQLLQSCGSDFHALGEKNTELGKSLLENLGAFSRPVWNHLPIRH